MSDPLADFLSSGGQIPQGTPTAVLRPTVQGQPSPAQINADFGQEAAGQGAPQAQLRTLLAERATQAAAGRVDPALDREILRAQNTLSDGPAQPMQRAVAPTVPQQQPVPKDPLESFLAAGGSGTDASVSSAAPSAPKPAESTLDKALDTVGEWWRAPGQAVWNQVSGLGASIVGGLAGLSKLPDDFSIGSEMEKLPGPGGQPAPQGSMADAARTAETQMAQRTYTAPPGSVGEKMSAAFNSPLNPLNWLPGLGRYVGEGAQELGAPPSVAAGLQTAIAASPLLFGLRGAPEAGEGAEAAAKAPSMANWLASKGLQIEGKEGTPIATAPTTEAASTLTATPAQAGTVEIAAKGAPATVAPEEVLRAPPKGSPAAAVESEPVENGLPPATQAERAAILNRIGLNKVWQSAVSGNALEGATNAQLARFPEPAGQAAHAQFVAENEALHAQATKVLQSTSGTAGLDEDALHARGQTIAAPFAALKNWFDAKENALYQAADERSQGLPTVSPQPIEDLLSDRKFKNTVMARNQQNVVSAAQDQLEAFKENNGGQLTVQNAEQFRQWLNQVWSNDNKATVGAIKDAVDEAVTKSAGEDVYGEGRALHAAKKKVLENPNGVGALLDFNPNQPISFEDIPRDVTRLSVDQYRNVIKELRDMPPELQPAAQRAIGEINAHFVNKTIEAGTPNTKTPSPFWNNRKVNNFLDDNRAKLGISMTPEQLKMMKDLRAAGNILSVDASYPGAAVQASQAVRHGLMSRIISPAATSAGGAVGAIFGPTGAAGGALAGRAVGERMSEAAAERAALKKVGKRMVPISEMLGGKK